jgi:hypothetical protein
MKRMAMGALQCAITYVNDVYLGVMVRDVYSVESVDIDGIWKTPIHKKRFLLEMWII